MKTTLSILSILAVTVFSGHGAIVIYNQDNPPTGTDLTSGGWGTYRGFSVSFADTALTTSYTTPDTTTPATLYLTELSIRHPGSQGSGSAPGDWTQALIKVYSGATASTATYLGDSTNIQNMSLAGAERNISFTFDELALTTSATYWFYFANTEGDGSDEEIVWTSGRLRVSNNVNHTYGSGNVYNNTFGNQDTAFDAVFSASFSSIPEPSAALLGGLGFLMMLRRRRN